MNALRLLGYAQTKPCSFIVDRASPHSHVSAAFLFRYALHQRLDSTGKYCSHLTICVPTQGGYYMSSDVQLKSSVTCQVDVVLGADWLACCQATLAVNVLCLPTSEVILKLTDGNSWIADGMFPGLTICYNADHSSRSIFAVLPPTHP